MPRAAIILLLIGLLLVGLAVFDMKRADGGNPVGRKARLRVGVFFIVIAIALALYL